MIIVNKAVNCKKSLLKRREQVGEKEKGTKREIKCSSLCGSMVVVVPAG
jgi:hypothetical protein